MLRLESPIQGEFRLARVPDDDRRRRHPRGHDRAGAATAPRTATRGSSSDPAEFRLDRANGRQHLGFGFGIHTCAGAPLARAEARVSLERLLDRMADIRISEAEHGPAGARRYEYTPIYMLRGLEQLHLEFTPVAGTAGREQRDHRVPHELPALHRRRVGRRVERRGRSRSSTRRPKRSSRGCRRRRSADVDRAVAAARRAVRRRTLAADVAAGALRRARAVHAGADRPARGARRPDHRRGGLRARPIAQALQFDAPLRYAAWFAERAATFPFLDPLPPQVGPRGSARA